MQRRPQAAAALGKGSCWDRQGLAAYSYPILQVGLLEPSWFAVLLARSSMGIPRACTTCPWAWMRNGYDHPGTIRVPASMQQTLCHGICGPIRHEVHQSTCQELSCHTHARHCCAGHSRQAAVRQHQPGREGSQALAAAGLWSCSPEWVTQRLLTLVVLARHLLTVSPDQQGPQQAGHLLASLYLKRAKSLLPGMCSPRLPSLAECWLVRSSPVQ